MDDYLKILEKKGKVGKRTLKDMKNFYKDKDAVKKVLKKKNPLIYTVKSLTEDEISYTLTIINPGKIGDEKYMTKGHYHKKNVSEVYYLLSGEGVILLKKGRTKKQIKMKVGKFSYIPKGFAHRTVNLGKKRLIFLSIYQTDSGHDYGTIEKEGF